MTRRASFLRDGALWGSAALVVLAAHLGGALWMLHRAEAAAPPGLPHSASFSAFYVFTCFLHSGCYNMKLRSASGQD